jgi:CRP-like cAMP-binding protein
MPAEADVAELAPLLTSVVLFSRCSEGECRQIAAKADIQSVSAGENVITFGAEGSELFIVLDGTAEAVIDGQVRNTFGPGEYFGELSALAPAPRTSDVVATTPCRLAVLSRGNLLLLVNSVPGVAAKMLEGMAIALRDRIQATTP